MSDRRGRLSADGSAIGGDAVLSSATRRACAATASVVLLSRSGSSELWPGATVHHDRGELLASWIDGCCGLPVTLRVSAPHCVAGFARTTAEWTLGRGGQGRAELRVAPRGGRSVWLRLIVSGDPGVLAHGLRSSSVNFVERLVRAAERRSLAS